MLGEEERKAMGEVKEGGASWTFSRKNRTFCFYQLWDSFQKDSQIHSDFINLANQLNYNVLDKKRVKEWL